MYADACFASYLLVCDVNSIGTNTVNSMSNKVNETRRSTQLSQTPGIDFQMSCSRSEINDARLESLDRSFEDPEHPTLGTRLDRR